jgi:deferrochelatase/peroxidase EfeB
MSFSLAAGAGRADLQALLARWSAAAAVIQRGKPRLAIGRIAGPMAAN